MSAALIPFYEFTVVDASDIKLQNAAVTCNHLLDAVRAVNSTLLQANRTIGDTNLHLFEIMDLRMLSGLVGELFVAELCRLCSGFLCRNKSIDGYPDLCDVSSLAWREKLPVLAVSAFINFPGGGLEVKNTFGVKKAGQYIPPRATRLPKIAKTLVWKAHHRETNNLIALQSDYDQSVPQIVAVFFSNALTPEDWTRKQDPREGSTMTSFCQTEKTAFEKLRRGLKICRNDEALKRFLGLN